MFNAAYEAGLKITSRTNHALYISHYPQGRDATVNYPDVDLKFVNDTDHWLLLRTYVGSSSLVVDLYGAPLHRRVESETRAARHHRAGAGEAHSRSDALRGLTAVDESGSPSQLDERAAQGLRRARQAAVRQHVVLVATAASRVVRVGTKPKPKPKKKIGPTCDRAGRAARRRDGVSAPQ